MQRYLSVMISLKKAFITFVTVENISFVTLPSDVKSNKDIKNKRLLLNFALVSAVFLVLAKTG